MTASGFPAVGATERRRRFGYALLGAVGLAALAGVLALAVSDVGARLPSGARVGGVDVGGMSPAEAERAVASRANASAFAPVLVFGPRRNVRTSATRLGARPRVAAAVDAAGASRFGVLLNLAGIGEARDVPLTWMVDRAAVASLARRLGPPVPAHDADVNVGSDGITVRDARAGLAIDQAALVSRLASMPAALRVPGTLLEPRITTSEARALAARIERLTSRARTIVVGTTATTLRPPALRSLVDVRAADGELRFTFDADRLAKLLPASTPARDAELQVRGDAVVVVPSVPGRTLDAAATARALAASERRTVKGAGTVTAPSVTTAELTALGIRERISQFTTYYPPGQPRVVNIQRASSVIDGTIVRAGETFSMNEVLGERTIAKGYVAAPQISGNGFSESVGGGISQVATMLYNGAFFAGLELVEHQPHSLYIDRYPLGREATVSWGGPELIFRNDWPAAVLIKLDATSTSITVRFFSSRLGRRVETTTSAPYGHGGGGFSVRYTRRVFRDDRLIRDEVFNVRYGIAPSHTTRVGGM